MEANLPSSLLCTLPPSLKDSWGLLNESHTQGPVYSIRVNPKKPSMIMEGLEQVPWCPNGFYFLERPIFTADPLLHAGAYYVQEASSMFLEYALKQCINFSDVVHALDLCAAPGGKSTLVASLLEDHSLLVSNEVIPSRASILQENITKWGLVNTLVCNNEASHFSRNVAAFNLLTVDAPCSGSGLFRKMPEFKNEWNTDLVHLCSDRQKRILLDSYPCLSKDGILVYMTCSLCEEENEDILDFILNEFDVEPIQIKIPSAWGIIETNSKSGGYGYRFSPHLLKGEGFFLSVFKKKDGESFVPHDSKTIKHNPKWLSPYLDIESNLILHQVKEEYLGLAPSADSFLKNDGRNLKWYKRGIKLGKVIREELIPDHELAVYCNCKFETRIELTLSEAIKYLRKEHINVESINKGWQLVCYQGAPLGWIKNLGNRVNNYYPTQYRIVSKNILPPMEN